MFAKERKKDRPPEINCRRELRVLADNWRFVSSTTTRRQGTQTTIAPPTKVWRFSYLYFIWVPFYGHSFRLLVNTESSGIRWFRLMLNSSKTVQGLYFSLTPRRGPWRYRISSISLELCRMWNIFCQQLAKGIKEAGPRLRHFEKWSLSLRWRVVLWMKYFEEINLLNCGRGSLERRDQG